jgi:hypothetical protein
LLFRSQRTFAGIPDGGIGPSTVCNLYHDAVYLMFLAAPMPLWLRLRSGIVT